MKKNKKTFKPKRFCGAFLVVMYILVILLPFYSMLLISIVPESQYLQDNVLLYPKSITWEAYQFVFGGASIWQGMLVTSLVTVFGTIYDLFLTITAAYILVQNFPGKKIYVSLLFIAMFFDGGLIANYLVVDSLGLIDTLFAMILPTGINVMFLLLLVKSFRKVPESLIESAKMDGANDFTILFKIMIPMAKPTIIALTLYYAVDRWNEWFLGMIYINSAELQPLQLLLRSIISNTNSSALQELLNNLGIVPFAQGIKMACTVVATIPILLLFPLLQKHFLNDTSGSTKE